MKHPFMTSLTSLLIGAGFMPSVLAAPSLPQQLQHCLQVEDKLERLICYDKLATQTLNQSIQSTDQLVTGSMAQLDDFGLAAKTPAETLAQVSLTIAAVDYNPYGEMKLTFTNGQIWRQLEAKRYRLKVGDQVEISRAALGSFLLNKLDRNASIRVKRIQ